MIEKKGKKDMITHIYPLVSILPPHPPRFFSFDYKPIIFGLQNTFLKKKRKARWAPPTF